MNEKTVPTTADLIADTKEKIQRLTLLLHALQDYEKMETSGGKYEARQALSTVMAVMAFLGEMPEPGQDDPV